MMLGWRSEAAERASRRKRSRIFSSRLKAGSSSLIATARSKPSCVASNTAPIPPRLISRGGMGAVFEATQLGLDRAVAIKVLLPALSRDEKVRERFRREARSAASLRHPNIIQIYDYGISD